MSDPSTELKDAAFAGDLDKVRTLVAAGANVNSKDASGAGTLLTFHPKVIEFLLEHGADPDSQTNENGASVLAGLSYVNQTECVRALLEYGADANLGRQNTLETPLHHALANDASLELIQLLIQAGADVNAKTNPGLYSCNYYGDTPTRGETPLHRAAAYAPLETVELLLKSSADRKVTDANGNTPFHWAGWHRRPKGLVELLR